MQADVYLLPDFEDSLEENTEVIALSNNGNALVGTISKNQDGTFFCESDETLLESVIAYMHIPILP